MSAVFRQAERTRLAPLPTIRLGWRGAMDGRPVLTRSTTACWPVDFWQQVLLRRTGQQARWHEVAAESQQIADRARQFLEFREIARCASGSQLAGPRQNPPGQPQLAFLQHRADRRSASLTENAQAGIQELVGRVKPTPAMVASDRARRPALSPARCTTEVSTLTTKSRLAMIAAVSAKSVTAPKRQHLARRALRPGAARRPQRHPPGIGGLQMHRHRVVDARPDAPLP